jgi:CRISPR-associated protein Csm1
MSDFARISAQLKSALTTIGNFKPIETLIVIQQYDGFIKGDVSGIQDFIFSVRSKGASKSLKSRSHFVGVLTDICVEMVEKQLGKNNFKLVYNGGGNFYGFIKGYKDGWEKELQKTIDTALAFDNIYICLTSVGIDTTDFGKVWAKAEQKSSADKQNKLKTLDFERVFNPFGKTPLFNSLKWSDFTQRLTHCNTYAIQKTTQADTKIESSFFQIFQYQYQLFEIEKGKGKFDGEITNKLPVWNQKGEVKTFEELAEEAYQRTGSQKLAVLKLDVDNLGKVFQKITDVNRAKSISSCLSWFFNQYFHEMWSTGTSPNGHKYSDNIYPVFAGGDDCFLIGAWDSVFEFSSFLHQEFKKFTNNEIKLSAALLVIDEHFPVIRFAEMAENALKEAKSPQKDKDGNALKDKDGNPIKDQISIFSEVLTWEEFDKAKIIAWKLYALIKEKGESRSLLDRIKRSKIGFGKLQEEAVNQGIIRAKSVWRLKYYLRNVKKTNKEAVDTLLNEYSYLLLHSYLTQKPTNPNIFPVAARWAEFLTKKVEKEAES